MGKRLCKICGKKMGNCYNRDKESNYFHPKCEDNMEMNLEESIVGVLKSYGNSGCYLYLHKKHNGKRVKVTFI